MLKLADYCLWVEYTEELTEKSKMNWNMSILAQFRSWVTTVATRKSAQMDLGKSKWKFPILEKRHLPKNWLTSFKITQNTAILAQFWSWVTTVGTRKNAQIDLGNIYWKFSIHKKRHLPKNWLTIIKIAQDTAIIAQFRSWVTKVAHRNNLGRNS